MQFSAVRKDDLSTCLDDDLVPLHLLALDEGDDPVRRAGDIYRHARHGRKVLAIGASHSARTLAAACDRIGIDEDLYEVKDVGPCRLDAGVRAFRPDAGPLRIALAGYGVVGQALAARLAREPGFEIVAILVRDQKRVRAVTPPVAPTESIDAFLAAPADILIDALSCDPTGQALSGRAIAQGIHVVSASKRVVQAAGAGLRGAAKASGASFLYSAAVGGAAPILETLSNAAARGPIKSVDAVLNGTVNFILDRLHKGADFVAALHAAREAGFAEEDCGFDLSGADAAAKLALIAEAVFGETVRATADPLDEACVARVRTSGERWVQVARLVHGENSLEAAIRIVPAREAGDALTFPDEWNGAIVTLADGTTFSCRGRGAGGAATAEAIVADLFDIAARSC